MLGMKKKLWRSLGESELCRENVSSQYYYRMLQTQKKEAVENEMKELTAKYQNDKLEFIKNPVVAEFLGLAYKYRFNRK